MTSLRFGIVGTGLIGGVMGRALAQAQRATLCAVASRTAERARAFAQELGGEVAAGSWRDLVGRDNVDAVYVATPTSEKEPIALAAIAARKHVLVDKPFVDAASVGRMLDAARNAGVVFMDATHFVHHPRTQSVREQLDSLVGEPISLHTSFHFPGDDPTNIRRQPALEPTGALGDMGWYAMRAVVEYLQPAADLASAAVATHTADDGAIIHAAGQLVFGDGKTSSFDVGYRVGALVQDLHLLGTAGALAMDDFVLDRQSSFAFDNADAPAGFTHRAGADGAPAPRLERVANDIPQHVRMLDAFADAVRQGGDQTRWGQAALATQRLLDAALDATQNAGGPAA